MPVMIPDTEWKSPKEGMYSVVLLDNHPSNATSSGMFSGDFDNLDEPFLISLQDEGPCMGYTIRDHSNRAYEKCSCWKHPNEGKDPMWDDDWTWVDVLPSKSSLKVCALCNGTGMKVMRQWSEEHRLTLEAIVSALMVS